MGAKTPKILNHICKLVYSVDIMSESKEMVPPEVIRFFISKDSFQEILGEKLGGQVKSIDISGETVEVTFSDSFLKSFLGELYDKEIESVDVDGNEVDVKVKQALTENSESEDNDKKDSDEGKGIF